MGGPSVPAYTPPPKPSEAELRAERARIRKEDQDAAEKEAAAAAAEQQGEAMKESLKAQRQAAYASAVTNIKAGRTDEDEMKAKRASARIYKSRR